MADALKVYPAYFKGDEALQVDEMFVKVWAVKGCSRTRAINDIFQYGIERMLDEDEELREKVDKSPLAIAKKWQEKVMEVTRQGQLEYIYEHSTPDEFIGFCEENGIDHEAFLAVYVFTVPASKTKSEAMARWLGQLLDNGDEYRVEDIKEAAEIDEIVGDDTDWSLMKTVASREGYSKGGRRGYWRKLHS